MKSYLFLPKIHQREIPDKFKASDNRFTENLVEYILQTFSKKGDYILDIFAGLGTTLFVSEAQGRIPVGLEIDKERYDYVKSNLQQKEYFIHGDALQLPSYNLPKCDLCFSSPPFMTKYDLENPFTNYSIKGTYEQYLEDISMIYQNLKEKMKEKALVVVDAANLKDRNGVVTTLAWDITAKISENLEYLGEIIIIWTEREKESVDGQNEPWRIAGTYGYGFDHSYLLIFRT
ncbi:MAG: site-specific DNA-methyltransferase [Candidatus Heimdallarchaeota archaeon]|nr:site-specific DNA-methyltransferase [Candidatus Heimdallarchaeota archaeon]